MCRHQCDFSREEQLLSKQYRYICGIDEVGRGAIFGPVVAGAVILNPDKLNFRIRDSKKLAPGIRRMLSADIYRNALAYSIGWCWNDEIDEINILQATRKSIKMAVRGLQISPDYVLLDGMKPDFLAVEGEGIVKGDDKSLSIAAASIIAKVFRDELMVSFSRCFPQYHIEKNKGYLTPDHIRALAVAGFTEFHRKSYKVSGLKNG